MLNGGTNRLGLQFVEGGPKTREIVLVSEHVEVDVAAELGGAVQNARLAAHQQRPHAVLVENGKDFVNRARAQAILPTQGTSSTAWSTGETAPLARAPTSPGPRDPPAARTRDAVESWLSLTHGLGGRSAARGIIPAT